MLEAQTKAVGRHLERVKVAPSLRVPSGQANFLGLELADALTVHQVQLLNQLLKARKLATLGVARYHIVDISKTGTHRTFTPHVPSSSICPQVFA